MTPLLYAFFGNATIVSTCEPAACLTVRVCGPFSPQLAFVSNSYSITSSRLNSGTSCGAGLPVFFFAASSNHFSVTRVCACSFASGVMRFENDHCDAGFFVHRLQRVLTPFASRERFVAAEYVRQLVS